MLDIDLHGVSFDSFCVHGAAGVITKADFEVERQFVFVPTSMITGIW